MFSAGGAWIFLDQSVSLVQIVGGVIVIAALIVVTRDDVSSQSKEKETVLEG